MNHANSLGQYEPRGTQFESHGAQMMLVLNDEPRTELHGWLLVKRNGSWVTFRKATDADICELSQAVSNAHHSED